MHELPITRSLLDLATRHAETAGGGRITDLYLEVTVDGEPMLPRAAVGSMPFAFMAGNAERLGGLTAAELMNNEVQVINGDQFHLVSIDLDQDDPGRKDKG